VADFDVQGFRVVRTGVVVPIVIDDVQAAPYDGEIDLVAAAVIEPKIVICAGRAGQPCFKGQIHWHERIGILFPCRDPDIALSLIAESGARFAAGVSRHVAQKRLRAARDVLLQVDLAAVT